MSRMSDYQIEVCGTKREELVEDETQRLLELALIDGAVFDQMNEDYEILLRHSGQLQRCLRNLDQAVEGKEYARDAIFTALSYMQADVERIVQDQAEKTIPTVEDLHEDYRACQLDARMDAAKDARLGL